MGSEDSLMMAVVHASQSLKEERSFGWLRTALCGVIGRCLRSVIRLPSPNGMAVRLWAIFIEALNLARLVLPMKPTNNEEMLRQEIELIKLSNWTREPALHEHSISLASMILCGSHIVGMLVENLR